MPVNRTVGDRRGRLPKIAAHIFVHVDRMKREIVVARTARTDLRIGRHQDRVTRSRLPAGLQREVGLEFGRPLRNAPPELRNAVLHGDFVCRGNGHLHEAPFRKVAFERIIPRLVGQRRQQSVAHDHAFDRQAPLVDDRSGDGRIPAVRTGSARRGRHRRRRPAAIRQKAQISVFSPCVASLKTGTERRLPPRPRPH